MTQQNLQEFIDRHTATVEPLSRRVCLAYWQATISGKEQDFKRFAELEVERQKIYADREAFAAVRAWRDNDMTSDPLLHRQVDVLYRSYLHNQVSTDLLESITRLSSEIVGKFNVYRARVDDREMSSNEVRKILKESPDSAYREKAWCAEKHVGTVVRDDLLRLVDLRNQAARSLGYDNYYVMSLELAEQTDHDVIVVFDRLEEQTRELFRSEKAHLDAILAQRCGVTTSELRPWHYHDPFFQEAPAVFDLELDSYFKDRDILELVRTFYRGLGLEVDDILERSDLFEKPGKEQHAYCMAVDRSGDIRVLANVRNDEMWTGTMLHELGHAVYDQYINADLPYLLREHAHVFTTEAIAMLFGRLSKDAGWIQRVTGVTDKERHAIAESARKQQRLAQLTFARWCQVMVRFERALYANPSQDLNALWWELVERYQMVSPPDGRNSPDWASKIHVVSAPVYYHNYMLGELLASQLDHHIQHAVLGGNGRSAFNGRAEVGDYLKKNVFSVGNRYGWNEMITRATGEPLTPRYFVEQFID